MIPKEAIEKAKSAGWMEPEPCEYDGIKMICYGSVAIDPRFWQCLGKALGWSDCTPCIAEEHRYPQESDVCKFCNKEFTPDTWNDIAHCFYDLILTDRDTDEFWNDLLAK